MAFGVSSIPVIGAVTKLFTAIFGDKGEENKQAHSEMMSVLQAHAAEFRAMDGRTWWDSLVDGLNRLPRPIMTFGTIALFAWAAMDPEEFAVAMVGFGAIPEAMWWILGAIVSFWFGGKIIQKDIVKSFKSFEPGKVLEAATTVTKMKQEFAKQQNPDFELVPTAEKHEKLAPSSEAPANPVVRIWTSVDPDTPVG